MHLSFLPGLNRETMTSCAQIELSPDRYRYLLDEFLQVPTNAREDKVIKTVISMIFLLLLLQVLLSLL